MEFEPDARGFFRVAELPSKEVLEGIRLRSVHLENLMMTFVEYPAGSAVPSHHHRYEQITYVLDGRLEVVLEGERQVVGPGEGVQIPANVEHSSRTIEGPVKALDAWTPVPRRFKVEPAEGEISG